MRCGRIDNLNKSLHALSVSAATLIWLLATPSIAGETATEEPILGDDVPLSEAELRGITAQALILYPQLASSPGVKAAYAQRSVRNTDLADIVYYPHSETGGVKEAYQLGCTRQVGEPAWTCDDVSIRRYLSLETQDFEVRVVGDIGNDEAMAVIDATRRALPEPVIAATEVPLTVIMVRPLRQGDDYLVWWRHGVDASNSEQLMMRASPVAGGDTAHYGGWQVELFEFPREQ